LAAFSLAWSTLDVDTLVTKINAEISHLGYGRKTRADEKLGSIDMNWLKPAIDSEIRRFEESLGRRPSLRPSPRRLQQ
jgi:hypothetical protein